MMPITGTVVYRSAFDDIINSNGLQSINDDTLRGVISYLGTIYKYDEGQTKIYSTGWNDYMLPYLTKNANFVYTTDSIPLDKIVPELKKIKRDAFINNTEFFNNLTLRNGYIQHFIGMYEFENNIFKSDVKRIRKYLELEPEKEEEVEGKKEEKE